MSGYKKINTDLFQKYFPKQELTGSEFRILLFIFWNTACFGRKYHPTANSYIAQNTGICERQVKRSVKSLCDKGYISIKVKGIGKHPQIIEINGDIFGHIWGHKWSGRGDTNGQKKTENVTQDIIDDINRKDRIEEDRDLSDSEIQELLKEGLDD